VYVTGGRPLKQNQARGVAIQQSRQFRSFVHPDRVGSVSEAPRAPIKEPRRAFKYRKGEAPGMEVNGKYSLFQEWAHEEVVS
jgi:hypothetical protein